MEIYVTNTEAGLIPLYGSDFDEKKKLKLNVNYRCEIRLARSYKFHKKFMALVKIGCENSKNVEMPFDAYRKYALIKSGYANIYKTPKGVFVEAQSMSFASMDEDKFQEVYSRVLDFIITDVDSSKEDIEKNLITFF